MTFMCLDPIVFSSFGSHPTWVIFRENLRPLLSCVCQTVSQADSLPSQQAVRVESREQRGVEDADRGLSHQQAAPKQVEVIQRHEETWRRYGRTLWSKVASERWEKQKQIKFSIYLFFLACKVYWNVNIQVWFQIWLNWSFFNMKLNL